MEVLVLGGTGAMGVPVVQLLRREGYTLYVTSRSSKESVDNINYIQGNAKDNNFLDTLLVREYDAIIDFMVYDSEELEERIDKLLAATKQYCFFSSSRVYAESQEPITENSSRLLDVCEDKIYLNTNEYALSKAREENILKNCGKKNWTIIRPYITYNDYRLQLGVYEKENWLYRALQGRTIIMPKDIAERKTTITYGLDVASAIVKLIGNQSAYGEIYHIVSTQAVTWGQILNVYLDTIEEKRGFRPKVKVIDDSKTLQKVWNPWQIKYDRLYNRTFDNSKILNICGECYFKEYQVGLKECISRFLEKPIWLGINWRYEAWADKIAEEKTPLKEIRSKKLKLKYLKWRYIQL